jgi:hypothetical protein
MRKQQSTDELLGKQTSRLDLIGDVVGLIGIIALFATLTGTISFIYGLSLFTIGFILASVTDEYFGVVWVFIIAIIAVVVIDTWNAIKERVYP